MKRIKRLSALLAAILLFTLTAPAAAAAIVQIMTENPPEMNEKTGTNFIRQLSPAAIPTTTSSLGLFLATGTTIATNIP